MGDKGRTYVTTGTSEMSTCQEGQLTPNDELNDAATLEALRTAAPWALCIERWGAVASRGVSKPRKTQGEFDFPISERL